MWELDYKEILALKNRCFWTLVLEKTLGSPLDCKEIKPVNPKGNQSWIFIGRNDTEALANTLATWCKQLTHWKRPLCWERLKAGGKGMTQDKIFRWHHWLNGHEFEKAPGVDDGSGSLNGPGTQWHATVHWVAKSQTRLNDWTMKATDWSDQIKWNSARKWAFRLELWL